MELHAIVLSGGRSTRMGTDKARLERRGRSLLDWTIAACSVATTVVVVGDPAPVERPVIFVREAPPFGGPVAGLAAGVAALPPTAEQVMVLATDLVDPAAAVAHLTGLDLLADDDGLALVDAEGVVQHLAARYRVAALQSRLRQWGDPNGASLRRFLQPLKVATVIAEVADVDTPEQWRLLSGD